jgi:hypothetical protein
LWRFLPRSNSFDFDPGLIVADPGRPLDAARRLDADRLI